MFLLPEEEGTVLRAPRGVSLCHDITNFAIVSYHTRQGRSPGTLHCNAGYDAHQRADPPTAGDVGAHRPASTQKTFPPTTTLERKQKQKPADAGLFYQAQARRDDATLGLPRAFPSLGVAPRDV